MSWKPINFPEDVTERIESECPPELAPWQFVCRELGWDGELERHGRGGDD